MTETTAGLLWPFRYAWVDPETVTSLVEAHGATPDAIVRPAYAGQDGFPILVPVALTERLAARTGRHGCEAVDALIAEGVPVRVLELGDPGIVYDIATPRSGLPGYQGPPQPAAGPPPEWNRRWPQAGSALRPNRPLASAELAIVRDGDGLGGGVRR